MQRLLKKAQTLLTVDLQLMVDAVLDDHDLKLLSDYIRLLQRHIEEMQDTINLISFSISEMQIQIDAFNESADIQREERQDFEQIIRENLSHTATYITIVGSEIPLDAEIADELSEQQSVEIDLRDVAVEVVTSLTERIETAETISVIILDAYHSGDPISDSAKTEIYALVTNEIQRVKQSKPIYQDDNVEAFLDYIRQQLRESRRKLRGDEY